MEWCLVKYKDSFTFIQDLRFPQRWRFRVKMEAPWSCKTLASFHNTIRRHNPEDWKMEAPWSCKTLASFHNTIRRHNPEDWRWRHHGPAKRWHPSITPYGVTIQKTSTWSFTTMKISNQAQVFWAVMPCSAAVGYQCLEDLAASLFWVWCCRTPMFQRTVTLPSSGWSGDEGSKVLQNAGILPQRYMASQPRRPQLEPPLPWKL